jgi:hypothetical protein
LGWDGRVRGAHLSHQEIRRGWGLRTNDAVCLVRGRLDGGFQRELRVPFEVKSRQKPYFWVLSKRAGVGARLADIDAIEAQGRVPLNLARRP